MGESVQPVRSTFAVRATQSLGQQMLNAPVGINGLHRYKYLLRVYLSFIYNGALIMIVIELIRIEHSRYGTNKSQLEHHVTLDI